MLKNPNRYSTLILQKGHQGCEIFYQIFPFSRHFAVQCKSFFFSIVFPDDFSFIFSSSLITQAFILHFQKIFVQIIFSAIAEVSICGKSGRAFYKTELWYRKFRKNYQKVPIESPLLCPNLSRRSADI